MSLADHWLRVTPRAGADRRATVFERLIALYVEPARHYHTARHVESLARWQDELAAHVHDPVAFGLAIWLHDAVYDPKRSDNEERSAALAAECLPSLGEEARVATVVAMIDATKRHEVGGEVADLALFLDCDLSILGAPADVYDAYAAAIRREYSFVPAILYRRERRKVLRRFLERKTLYFTIVMRDRLEVQARENLARELGGAIS